MPSLQGLFYRLIFPLMAPPLHHEVAVETIRQGLDDAGRRGSMPEGTQTHNLTVAGMPALWITPPGEPSGVILYLHGGAYVAGSIISHQYLVGYVAQQAGMPALLPEYRLAPEHPFPAAFDDALAAYRWLLDEGHAPARIVVMGDSAGGGLSLALVAHLPEAGLPPPAAVVLLSPWTDLAATGESLRTRKRRDPWLRPEAVANGAAMYHGETPAADPQVSPLYADLSGLPPVLIQVGDHEILLSDSQRAAAAIRAAGGTADLSVWPWMWHVFQSFTDHMPESRRAVAQIAQFIREQVGSN